MQVSFPFSKEKINSETTSLLFWKVGIYPLLILLGLFFAWRITKIPSRAETSFFITSSIFIIGLKYPKASLNFILIFSCFIPLFRRAYFSLYEKPNLDFLMLITDGALISLFLAIVMSWIINKTKYKDKLSLLIFSFIGFLIIKIFVLNMGSTINSLFAFKFYGLYILLYFAGSSLITKQKNIKKILTLYSIALFFTALYSIKQILFGYFEFENLWINSIKFTTLAIDGQIRTFSSFASPAALSDAMCILFILGSYLTLHKPIYTKLSGFILILSSIPPLLFATVRSNWIACLLSIWLMYVLFRKMNRKMIFFNIILLPIIFYFMMGSNTASESASYAHQESDLQTQNMTQVMITNRTKALANPIQEDSFQKRVETWDIIIKEVYYNYPLGKGLGTTSYAHSFYFQILGELGYLGLLLFLLILYMVIRRGIILIRFSTNHDTKLLATALTSILLIICLLNITGTHLNSHPSDIIFWIACGFISQLYRQHVKQTLLDEPKISHA